MKYFAAYTVAIELVRELRPIIEQIARHSREASSQLERAATSIVLNVAEGNRRHGRDPIRFFWMASGSSSEVLAVLDLARVWGWRIDDEHARELLDRERRLLWGLTHPKHKPEQQVRAGAGARTSGPRTPAGS